MTSPADLRYLTFYDDLDWSINLARMAIAQAQEQINRLEAQRSFPRVLATLHYKRYHAEETSDISEGQTLEQAYHQLWHLCYDNGTGAPVGVEVGGYMITWDELVAEFGEYDPW